MVSTLIAAAAASLVEAGIFTSVTAATFAVSFALSQVVTRIFAENPETQQDMGVRQQVPPSAVNAIPVVYGDAYMGGTFVDAVLTTDQKTMYYVLAISSIGQANATLGTAAGVFNFDTADMYYGDRKITFDSTDLTKVVSLTDEAGNVDTKISGNLYISLYTSSNAGVITSANGASAPSTVMGGVDIASAQRWPSSNRQMNNLAFAIVKLVYNRDADTTALNPITFHVSHYPNGASVAKPGDVWLDYIINTAYGGAIPPSSVDTTCVATLNAYSDALITYTPSGGGSPVTQARYRINGVLDAGQTVLSNIDRIMSACDSWMTYSAALGQWSVVINKSETAAYAFTDNNIIGDIRLSATDITSSINQVEARFPFKSNRDQASFVNLQTPSGLLYPNEPVNKYSITYDLVNDSVQAQYLANRLLEQAREDLIVSFNTTYYGIQVDAGNVVSVTNSDYGWNSKLFRVMKVNEASLPDGSLGARLELSEYSADVYDDASITQYAPAANSNLASPSYFSALSAPTVSSSSPSATVATFNVDVTTPATGRVTFGTLYYTTTPATSTSWKVLGILNSANNVPVTNSTTFTFANMVLPSSTYYFAFTVGNETATSVRSPTSSSFTWSPVNSESANVSALQTDVYYLSIDVADKVSKTSTSILTGTIVPTTTGGMRAGTITWNSSGVLTGGSGVAITSGGIVGAQAGVPTFTIDTAGNATFMGDINTDGDAYFEGRNTASFTVIVNGTPYNIDYSSLSNAATTASGKVRAGVVGYAISLGSTFNVGVLGVGHNGLGTPGIGVVGEGDQYGGFFSGATAGLVAVATGTGNVAFQISSNGQFVWNGYTIPAPTGSTSTFLRNDGTWAPASGGGGGTVTSVSGTGSVSGLTLSGTVTSSGSLTLGGSLSLTSGNVTSALGYTPLSSFNGRTGPAITLTETDLVNTSPSSSYFLSGVGWIPVTVVNTLNGASGSVSNSFSANNSIPGITISVSGSGTNSVTYNFSSTSDRSLKKDITPIDKGLDFVNKLRPVTYSWNTEHITFDKKTYGLIANEVLDEAKEESSIVYTNTGGVFEGKLAVDYQSLVPVLIKAIQELTAKVEALETQLKG